MDEIWLTSDPQDGDFSYCCMYGETPNQKPETKKVSKKRTYQEFQEANTDVETDQLKLKKYE